MRIYRFSVILIASAAMALMSCHSGNDAQEASEDKTSFVDVLHQLDETYVDYTQFASFPGGDEELVKFLKDNVVYPEECAAEGIQGRVIVNFMVNENGSLTDIKVARPVNPLLDAEAVRVVKSMPDWIPGKSADGQPVSSRYSIPVLFAGDRPRSGLNGGQSPVR